MHFFFRLRNHFFSLLVFLIVLTSCTESIEVLLDTPVKININNLLTLSVKTKNNQKIDAVIFYIDDKKVGSSVDKSAISIADYKLGKHQIRAEIRVGRLKKSVTKAIYFLADTKPVVYDFEIINTYPHDSKAYTQGLFFHNGFLYEGTGRYGSSSIRKVAISTGEVLQKMDLEKKYFGEGIALFNDEIHQLTWKNNKGFVYDLNSFDLKKSFGYDKSREGWGLTSNKKHLIKSDGTERIWFLDPNTHKELNYIEVYTNKRKVTKLNELEFINGLIYANVWQKNALVMINPTNGKVEGIVDLGLLMQDIQKQQKIDKNDEVLNGIAYDQENDRLFVTGKKWGKLFEIKLKEKN